MFIHVNHPQVREQSLHFEKFVKFLVDSPNLIHLFPVGVDGIEEWEFLQMYF